MSSKAVRLFTVEMNWGRVLMALALVTVIGMMMVEPAHAFDTLQSKITSQTSKATDVAQKILLVAAVLAIVIGLAPMLWGQIKVKWLVTSLCACVLFGLAGAFVTAFSG